MPADVKASLPEYEWEPQMVLTVTVDDPGATITALHVYVSQDVPGSEGERVGPFMLVPGAAA